MATKFIILATILILDYTLSCEYHHKYNSAVCPSLQLIQRYGTPDWHNIKIKNFDNTSLASVKDNTFRRTPNLQIITFQKSINSISENSINHLQKLQKLELFDNDVKTIPGSLFANSPVERVYFINSGIQNLGSQLFSLPVQLTTLYIRMNSIKHIKDDVFSDSRLRELYLENNNIETIDKFAFINMPDLNRLSLAGNNLKDLNLMNLFGTSSTNLERLWLGKNQLTTISKNMFVGTPKLRYLFLESNEIGVIQDGAFNELQNLVGLDISNNKLWIVSPKVFPDKKMSNLEVFLMHNNKMTFIEQKLFEMLPKLKYLSIYGNPLQCPCYQDLRVYLGERLVTRVCGENDKESRPKCIYREKGDNEKKCSYNLEANMKLYFDYMDAMRDYPAWEEKCHFAEGYEGLAWAKPSYQHPHRQHHDES